MRREIITKILLILMIAVFSQAVYADTTAELVFKITVPKATAIKKLLGSSSPITVNPSTGALTGGTLAAEFELDSNITDKNQSFVMTSSVMTQSGNVSGYDSSGNLLFTNINNLPTSADITDALSHSGNNSNVIVYPVTITTTSPMTYEFQAGHSDYGNCYIINVNGLETGTITQTVDTNPIANTYHCTRDTAGTYRAVITLTAIPD